MGSRCTSGRGSLCTDLAKCVEYIYMRCEISSRYKIRFFLKGECLLSYNISFSNFPKKGVPVAKTRDPYLELSPLQNCAMSSSKRMKRSADVAFSRYPPSVDTLQEICARVLYPKLEDQKAAHAKELARVEAAYEAKIKELKTGIECTVLYTSFMAQRTEYEVRANSPFSSTLVKDPETDEAIRNDDGTVTIAMGPTFAPDDMTMYNVRNKAKKIFRKHGITNFTVEKTAEKMGLFITERAFTYRK